MRDGVVAWASEDAIYLGEPKGRGWSKFRDAEVLHGSLSWSPDGRHLLWVDGGEARSRIIIAAIDGSTVVELGDRSRTDSDPAWSPSGDRVVWQSEGDLWVADVDGGDARAVIQGDANDLGPTWSPDGSRIAWNRSCYRNCDVIETGLYAARVDGTEVRRVEGTSDRASSPTWSPASDRIARVGAEGVVVTDPQGAVVEEFAGYVTSGPFWSPDGTELAWVTNERGVRIADLASGHVKEVAGPGAVTDLAWAPAGADVVVSQTWDHRGPTVKAIGTNDGARWRHLAGSRAATMSVSWRPVARIRRCQGLQPTLIGTSGPDVLTGTGADDVVVGLGGADRVSSRGGQDRVCGDAGDDHLRLGSAPAGTFDGDRGEGGTGDDTIIGGRDEDRMRGGPGNDVLRGYAGNDRLRGGAGRDRITGHGGHDTLRGDDGHDVLKGHRGRDDLIGGRGRDVLKGHEDKDDLRGGKGHDTLRGGADKDWLRGHAGRDRLYGGRHWDSCHGNRGRDRAWSCEMRYTIP
ncbi:hypothetical protein KUV85_02815 [Nocardioides panacisoli]|uniref:hypothetical protein n=1 Tax=Nocardioides panacisoli TaxID=627624 RepID=UPI001C6326A8|nr:hypothetical protein [Nocardioides panacisoli]QYJ04628.1 hypothetical protein KUV85_02815 [Nocardioides panacisoli]